MSISTSTVQFSNLTFRIEKGRCNPIGIIDQKSGFNINPSMFEDTIELTVQLANGEKKKVTANKKSYDKFCRRMELAANQADALGETQSISTNSTSTKSSENDFDVVAPQFLNFEVLEFLTETRCVPVNKDLDPRKDSPGFKLVMDTTRHFDKFTGNSYTIKVKFKDEFGNVQFCRANKKSYDQFLERLLSNPKVLNEHIQQESIGSTTRAQFQHELTEHIKLLESYIEGLETPHTRKWVPYPLSALRSKYNEKMKLMSPHISEEELYEETEEMHFLPESEHIARLHFNLLLNELDKAKNDRTSVPFDREELTTFIQLYKNHLKTLRQDAFLSDETPIRAPRFQEMPTRLEKELALTDYLLDLLASGLPLSPKLLELSAKKLPKIFTVQLTPMYYEYDRCLEDFNLTRLEMLKKEAILENLKAKLPDHALETEASPLDSGLDSRSESSQSSDSDMNIYQSIMDIQVELNQLSEKLEAQRFILENSSNLIRLKAYNAFKEFKMHPLEKQKLLLTKEEEKKLEDNFCHLDKFMQSDASLDTKKLDESDCSESLKEELTLLHAEFIRTVGRYFDRFEGEKLVTNQLVQHIEEIENQPAKDLEEDRMTSMYFENHAERTARQFDFIKTVQKYEKVQQELEAKQSLLIALSNEMTSLSTKSDLDAQKIESYEEKIQSLSTEITKLLTESDSLEPQLLMHANRASMKELTEKGFDHDLPQEMTFSSSPEDAAIFDKLAKRYEKLDRKPSFRQMSTRMASTPSPSSSSVQSDASGVTFGSSSDSSNLASFDPFPSH